MSQERSSRKTRTLAPIALGLLGLTALSASGCSKAPKPPAAPGRSLGAGVERSREVASRRPCVGRQRVAALLGADLPEDASPESSAERYTTDPLANALSPSEAYRVGAPATVLVRTRDGLGTGVVVDPSGLVLTNHHVVDGARQRDLTMHVTLELPTLSPTSRVTRSGKTYEGVVVRADAAKDLALVRIVDPPKGLAAIRLSGADPQVGENVLSIGHAGIGLLWAAKSCSVSNVGDQTRDTSMPEVGDCQLRDQADSDKEARRRAEQCEAKKRQLRERVEASTQGLAVQTSCNITHGDSGGPLLNAHGELVGLNQSLRFDAATVAFHVHVAEIRAFLRDVPKGPAQIVPDAYCEGGSEASADDFDGDGKRELVRLAGRADAFFVDLDQDDGQGPRSWGRPFDAELVVLVKEDDTFAWYDTDGDGQYDVLLRDKESDGSVEVGWRAKPGGPFVEDESLQKKKTVDVSLFAAALRPRLGSVAQNVGWTKLASAETLAASDALSVPDPFAGAVQMAHAMGLDGPTDRPVVVFAGGPSGEATYVDTRGEALAALKAGDDARALIEKRALKPELAVLGRQNGRWAFYDRGADGKPDLALFARAPSDREGRAPFSNQYVTDAFDLGGAEPSKAAASDYLGRALVRPRLLPNDKARRAAGRFSRGAGRDADDGRSTFPAPLDGVPVPVGWRLTDFGAKKRRVLERVDKDAAVALVDLDGDTKALATRSPDDLVRQQSFDAEAAFLRLGRLAWAYYDTDRDGAFDLIAFTKDATRGTIDAAYQLNRAGDTVTPLRDAKGSIFQPERVLKRGGRPNDLKAVWDRVRAAEDPDPGPRR
jgi:S1-C subfamily serine protease